MAAALHIHKAQLQDKMVVALNVDSSKCFDRMHFGFMTKLMTTKTGMLTYKSVNIQRQTYSRYADSTETSSFPAKIQ